MSLYEGSDEPSPGGSLVVRTISLVSIAPVTASILGIAGGKRSQPVGCQQFPAASIDDRPLLPGLEEGLGVLTADSRQRNREKLVRTQGPIVAGRGIEDVVAVTGGRIPKALEPGDRSLGEIAIFAIGTLKNFGDRFGNSQGVVPQGVNLHGFAVARRHHPVIHFGIHPSHLHPRFSGINQSILPIPMDVVSSALPIPADDFFNGGENGF